MNARLKRFVDWRLWLVYTHRWLGIAGCVLFVAWFFSGVVMMYARMPTLAAEERLARAAPLDLSTATHRAGRSGEAGRRSRQQPAGGDVRRSAGVPVRRRRPKQSQPGRPVRLRRHRRDVRGHHARPGPGGRAALRAAATPAIALRRLPDRARPVDAAGARGDAHAPLRARR